MASDSLSATVADFIWPPDFEDAHQTAANECLDLVHRLIFIHHTLQPLSRDGGLHASET